MKRVLKITGIVIGVLFVMTLLITIGYVEEQELPRLGATSCLRDKQDFLTAQAVPTAQYVPCFTDAAAGWTVGSQEFSNDGAKFMLMTEKVQDVEWTITFTSSCQPPSGEPVAKPGNPARVIQQTVDQPEVDGIKRTEWMTFPGGCVISSVTVPGRLDRDYILNETDELIALVARSLLNADVVHQSDGQLTLDPAPTGAAPSSSSTTTSTPSSSSATTRPRRASTTEGPDTDPDDTQPDDTQPDDTDPDEGSPGGG